ncbi:TPA: hypothetical protein TVN94_000012 [Streptococcus equi subsp. zooepidemicus]|uniref:virulence-associated E family protein n=1 Tax=Streptococcus equi TaxID=1336 RepID=UPI001E4C1FEE|nr:virulence-associated E family protein [Streptococcus equi]MCD3406923.1 virulence-associated E family protein [Streptococcus equi subsp. zooepidemicus]MDI5946367.1 virulence-associated E family protein [Streptococcus equi subsp. zooepidemicus]MDI5957376.1 virulence-associated E family protein [Streptococcus equi subsp. zooepidemicus]MDI6087995.1 virulence-associated E family protein [Streptococcus equi subsp. zooepidemicus]HEK9985574.1 hypothetical protein [Streptococcus equi subsp. zooepide
MQKLKIAYGSSCFVKKWTNKEISFDDLCKRLSTTIYTSETKEEYPKLPKSEKDRVKDKGGFVGGSLKGGSRKGENVECRSMLTLDVDQADIDFIDRFTMLCTFTCCLYTTHSHTKEKPRLRIIVPLSRNITPEEYVAVSRYFASDWEIDMFDECSYRPQQLMYWPTTPSNGDFVFEKVSGTILNPDDILLAHPEWTDPTLLPTSSRESVARGISDKKQADPLEKEGIVGAFNRAFYPINTVIEELLSDIYETSDMENRYRYFESQSQPGLLIHEGKFAYSHHAKDPAYLKLLSAFDLVRIHKFYDDDPKKSFNAMSEFAITLDSVKLQIAEEKKKQAEDDFKSLDEEDGDWRLKLKLQPRSKILENSVWNEMLILNNDPDFANFGYNEMASRIQITGAVPWERPRDNKFWRDADTAQMKALIDVKYVTFSTRNHDVAFTKVADDRRFHPIRDYLNNLPEWDGVSRIDTILIDYFGAENTNYTREVSRKTLVAAVARIYKPGTKFDSVLILNGAQGIGKSTFFSKLAGDWFSDSLTLTDMKDKSGAEKLQGYWILELGELAGMKKADIESVKSFISRTDDEYRPSYGKTVESHPRQCIIVGSTNSETGFLRDITGNRRFWPVSVNGKSNKKSWQMTKDEVEQIWAEAVHFYNKDEKLYLEGDTAVLARSKQADAMESDEREGIVREYLDKLLPDNWDDMDLYERRHYLSDSGVSGIAKKGIVRRTTVCNMEIWCECFGKDPSVMKKIDSYELGGIMQKIDGWQKSNSRRISLYGKQRIYERNKG